MPQTAAQTMLLTIVAPLQVATPNLPNAVQGQAYSVQFAAQGGVAPYTWALTGGTLPAGLTLSPSGLLSGTPTSTGQFSLTVTVTDSGS